MQTPTSKLPSPIISVPGPRAIDFISVLPVELSVLVLSLLPIHDVFTCSRVSRTWRTHAIGNDTIYLPHLLAKYNAITHGRDPIPARANASQELLHRFPRLSASTYFANPHSLRDLAMRDLRLLKMWRSGVPRRRVDLNAGMRHSGAILSVLIDPVYGLVISGSRAGEVVFWSVETKTMVKRLEFARQPGDGPLPCPAVSAMALDGGHLVIGTWQMKVHIARRDPGDVPNGKRAFSPVSSFRVPSSVISILLEGTTCIAGCHRGEVLFYNIGLPPEGSPDATYTPTHILTIQTPPIIINPSTSRNLSLHYRRPFLFTSSTLVSQLTPKRVDPTNTRELWEYPEGDIIIKNSSGTPFPPPLPQMGDSLCIIRPLGGGGDLLVAWPDRSVYSLGNFNSRLVWSPKYRVLVEEAGRHMMTVRCMDTVDGFFLTGSFDHTVRLFTDDGTPVGEPFVHKGAVNSIAADPCYFVSVSDDRSVVLWDFTPPAPPQPLAGGKGGAGASGSPPSPDCEIGTGSSGPSSSPPSPEHEAGDPASPPPLLAGREVRTRASPSPPASFLQSNGLLDPTSRPGTEG